MKRKVLIKGDKISLIVPEKEDIELYYTGMNNIQTQHLLGYNARTFSLEDEEKYFESMNKDNTSQIFCIMINETKTVIGNVGLNKIDHINKCGFFGIVIFEDNNCGKGYGKESIELVHIFAKQHLNLRKICLHVYGDNKNAIKLYSKIGYKEVGRWKNHKLYNGNFIDDVMMEIFL